MNISFHRDIAPSYSRCPECFIRQDFTVGERGPVGLCTACGCKEPL